MMLLKEAVPYRQPLLFCAKNYSLLTHTADAAGFYSVNHKLNKGKSTDRSMRERHQNTSLATRRVLSDVPIV
jgi:hypothetical protein